MCRSIDSSPSESHVSWHLSSRVRTSNNFLLFSLLLVSYWNSVGSVVQRSFHHGEPSAIDCARFEEAYSHCDLGPWSGRQVSVVHHIAIDSRSDLYKWRRMVSDVISKRSCRKCPNMDRSPVAENWRRRGKFEEVKFVFPNVGLQFAKHMAVVPVSNSLQAPTIPITVVW